MISSFLLWSYSVHFAVSLKNFTPAVVILALACSFSVQVSLPYSKVGTARVVYTGT
jgi:hypothetical protein